MNEYYLPNEAFTEKELSCLSMVVSNIVYDSDFLTNKWSVSCIKDVGIDRATELWVNQKNYFNMYFEIVKNVHTDNDGLSYNSVREKNIK